MSDFKLTLLIDNLSSICKIQYPQVWTKVDPIGTSLFSGPSNGLVLPGVNLEKKILWLYFVSSLCFEHTLLVCSTSQLASYGSRDEP